MLSKEYLNNIYGDLEAKLYSDNTEDQKNPEYHRWAVSLGAEAFKRLGTQLRQYGFPDAETEIFYYKHICPSLLSEILFHQLHLNFLSERQQLSSSKSVKKRCKQLLKSIKAHMDTYEEIISYRASGHCHRDEELFIRKQGYPILLDESFIALEDTLITGYSVVVGRTIAYLRMKPFYKSCFSINFGAKNTEIVPTRKSQSDLLWTGSKVNLVELAYALHAEGCINNGNCDISRIINTLEDCFNVKLSNHYDIFADIKQRRNPVQFLQKIQNNLSRKINSTFATISPFSIPFVIMQLSA